MTSVKVAVRCRPFNQREKDLNAKLIIRMESGNTYITNPVSFYFGPDFDFSCDRRTRKRVIRMDLIIVIGPTMVLLSQKLKMAICIPSLVRGTTIRSVFSRIS